MLDYIRSNAQSLGVKLAFGIIILVFVFWGVGSFTERNVGGTVAVVNGEIIQIQHYERAYQNAEEAALRNSPELTREALRGEGFGLQVFKELASEILLRQYAEKNGISVSPFELRQVVARIKTFQDAQGKFSPETYKRILASQRTNPAQYEQSLSATLLRDKLYALITSAVWISPDEAKNRYNFIRQTRKIEYIFLPARNFAAASSSSVDAEEIQAYYDAHKADFMLPPKVAIEYVMVKPEMLLQSPDEKIADRLHDALDNLMEANILNKDLGESAARFGLLAQKTPLLTQAEIATTLGLVADKATVFFNGSAGRPIDVVLEAETKEHFIIARILEITQKSQALPNEVKDVISMRIGIEKGLAVAKEQAALQLKKLDDAALTDTRKKELQTKTASLQRADTLDDFQSVPLLDEAIFSSIPRQWIPTVFIVDSKSAGIGALLCRTTAILDPEPQEWQSLRGLMENIAQRERIDGIFQTFMLNLFSQAKIEILNRNVIERRDF